MVCLLPVRTASPQRSPFASRGRSPGWQANAHRGLRIPASRSRFDARSKRTAFPRGYPSVALVVRSSLAYRCGCSTGLAGWRRACARCRPTHLFPVSLAIVRTDRKHRRCNPNANSYQGFRLNALKRACTRHRRSSFDQSRQQRLVEMLLHHIGQGFESILQGRHCRTEQCLEYDRRLEQAVRVEAEH